MRLVVAGKSRQFVEVRAFRASLELPESLGVAYFEPKDYTGLGRN